ncbi:MAG: thiamine phosphate synthase [Peptococcaceae bacterium]|nr:thiamine phosphate synthase [Peptococcaceae bacterium]
MSKLNWDYSLYLVTDRSYIGKRTLADCVKEAIKGGASLVQLREKTASSREFYELALQLKEITGAFSVPFIINDRLDIALAVDADGLHLGQDDLPIKIAREYFGKNKVIGISVSNVQEAIQAQEEGADYLGAGAIYATGTKLDADLVSLAELKKIKEAVSIPVVAIGGIKKENAASIMATGIDGISVVSAILAEDDIYTASKNLKTIVTAKK